MIKDTEEGKTHFCEACEAEIKYNYEHTCGLDEFKGLRKRVAYQARQELIKELKEKIEKMDWECFEQEFIKKDILNLLNEYE